MDRRGRALQPEALRALDHERQLGLAQVVEREGGVEEADERAERGGGVVVLRLAEQQRRAALDVAQVDVVAERRADDRRRWRRRPARPPAPGCSRSRSGGCRHRRPVPTAAMDGALVKISASGPMPTSRYWLQAPCADQHLLEPHRLRRAGLQLGEVVADQRRDLLADRDGRGRRRRARAPR